MEQRGQGLHLALAVILVVAATAGGAYGRAAASPCVVTGRGSSSYGNLQVAVNAASAGDALEVSGTCVGTTVIDRSLTIAGVGSGSETSGR